jgi:putative transposase
MTTQNVLTGDDLRELMEHVLPQEAIVEMVEAAKFQERSRKRDAVGLVRAMVIAAATGYGGRQRDVARLYFENGAPPVARGGFYAWFGPQLETTMASLSRRALDYAQAQPLDLPPLLLRYARDWHIVDSETIKLPDEMLAEYPGTGSYAALKVHKRLSVGTGTVYQYHFSPAREHDAPHLKLEESWRGLGLLVDLGYASLKFIADCRTYGISLVMRLKESWKPKVQSVARGELHGTFFPGTDLDAMLKDKTLVLDGRVIDAEVTVGQGRSQIRCRLCGVPAPDGSYRFYLTNLPPRVGPHQVADIYRVRWEIESDNKLDKSCNHLHEVRAQTGPAVRALIHASLISSMLACLVVHRHRLKQAPPPHSTAERTTPPLHPQSVARAMGSAACSIAGAFDLSGDQAQKEWQHLAQYLEHMSKDPNWRRSPSILDQLRGWPITPGRPKSARLSSASRKSA